MFTGKPLPSFKPLPDSVREAGWAAGFVYATRQSALEFGSDRREPVAARPVVEVRPDGARRIVLPCTSKDNSRDANFRELTDQIEWTRSNTRRTFVYARYETIMPDAMFNKIGVLGHPARIQLLDWLKERY